MSPRPIRPSEVVLGLIEPEDRPEVDRLLAEDPLFREEVARLRRTSTALQELDRAAWRPESPPPLVSLPATAPPRTRRFRIALVSAAAIVTLLVVQLATDDRATEPKPSQTLALRAIGDVPGKASLVITGDAAELRGSGMPPSGAHDFYEAWLADDRGRMVSMGSFRVGRDGRVDAKMPVAVDVSKYALIDVSLEKDDGNPAHSKVSVMRATLPS